VEDDSRMGDVAEEIIGGEILDVDMEQVAGAVVNCAVAHGQEHEVGFNVARIAHVDGAPQERLLRDAAPHGAHALGARQDFDCAQLLENRAHHVSRKVQPVSFFFTICYYCLLRRRPRHWERELWLVTLTIHLFIALPFPLSFIAKLGMQNWVAKPTYGLG